jgi:hypothetical protein
VNDEKASVKLSAKINSDSLFAAVIENSCCWESVDSQHLIACHFPTEMGIQKVAVSGRGEEFMPHSPAKYVVARMICGLTPNLFVFPSTAAAWT